ncbi:unnamed protein product [Parnassius mnemosyne]|uniref:Uncharacterized protein n=1 Tax=Parnassius mnemosyne TaxID=213953 RepID=A0AAV1LKS3_9NEOP
MYNTICFCLLSIITYTFALPNPEVRDGLQNPIEPTIGKDCSGGIFSATCLKIEAISLLEKLSSKEEVQLLPGVSVIKEEVKENATKAEEFAAELARALTSKADERLDKYLLYILGNYLDTHSVKLRLFDESTSEEARDLISEARGKRGLGGGGGKKGGLGGLVAAAVMMKGELN